MSKTYIDAWIEESDENRKAYKQESLIHEVTESIWGTMLEKDWKQADLGRALKVSRARIKKLLDGSSNMTLRTLSDIADALSVECMFSLKDVEKIHADWQNIGLVQLTPVKKCPPVITVVSSNDEEGVWTTPIEAPKVVAA